MAGSDIQHYNISILSHDRLPQQVSLRSCPTDNVLVSSLDSVIALIPPILCVCVHCLRSFFRSVRRIERSLLEVIIEVSLLHIAMPVTGPVWSLKCEIS